MTILLGEDIIDQITVGGTLASDDHELTNWIADNFERTFMLFSSCSRTNKRETSLARREHWRRDTTRHNTTRHDTTRHTCHCSGSPILIPDKIRRRIVTITNLYAKVGGLATGELHHCRAGEESVLETDKPSLT